MNYPTVMTNPLLKKRDNRQMADIDMMERPLSFHPKPTTSAQRPFSTNEGGETLMHKRKALQFKTMAKDASSPMLEKNISEKEEVKDKGIPHIYSVDRLSSASNF